MSYRKLLPNPPPHHLGSLILDHKERVSAFQEKPKGDGAWINGGFFVLEPSVLKYIKDDQSIWERGPLEKIAADGKLVAYKHTGFWQPMDTLRDKQYLQKLWDEGDCPWKCWE